MDFIYTARATERKELSLVLTTDVLVGGEMGQGVVGGGV